MQRESQEDFLDKVSIIIPFYNAAQYLHEAIQSVLDQSYPNWELLLINDGSTDASKDVVFTYKDTRIRYFEDKNKGVSAARNVGLLNMRGEYVCFLDADDILTPNSLIDRVRVFNSNSDVSFVDGTVYVTNRSIKDVTRIWKPTFKGYPKQELLHLKDTCFVTGSWMIRKEAIHGIRFRDGLTHSEDLLFLIEISGGHRYDFTETTTLYFRRTGTSAMANLDGLALGYITTLTILTKAKLFDSNSDRSRYKIKMMKVMFLSYLADKKWIKAFSFVMRVLFL